MLFDSWTGLGRVAIVGMLAYVALVFLLRISGKRTLSKLNAFDLVITVALGSTLATILLSKDVALLEGVSAFAVLILLQFVITWTSFRSARVQHLIKAQPTLLYFRGKFLERALRRERVTQAEVQAAVRQQGIADRSTIEAIVLGNRWHDCNHYRTRGGYARFVVIERQILSTAACDHEPFPR